MYLEPSSASKTIHCPGMTIPLGWTGRLLTQSLRFLVRMLCPTICTSNLYSHRWTYSNSYAFSFLKLLEVAFMLCNCLFLFLFSVFDKSVTFSFVYNLKFCFNSVAKKMPWSFITQFTSFLDSTTEKDSKWKHKFLDHWSMFHYVVHFYWYFSGKLCGGELSNSYLIRELGTFGT